MNDDNATSTTSTLPGSQSYPQISNQGETSEKLIPDQNTNPPAVETGGMQDFITSPQPGAKTATGKIIATILSIFILAGGVMAGVFLVNQQQEIRSKASEQDCLQSDNCIILQDPDDNGSYQINGIIYDVYLTDENANIFGAGTTEDGCYRTLIDGNSLTWERVGPESECKNIVNIQVWMIEIPEQTNDPVVSQCRDIKIYDNDWNQISENDLNAGDNIYIAVASITNAGSIEQARFIINNTIQQPTNLIKPESNELYMQYTIPEDVDKLQIEVELKHSTFGWF
ncbi:hypothetical protein JXA63_04615 [Candidatus Woesebacteria bacterium]|nr:hypothetical protein [Candidatus Woesebacteria bacterium]